MAGKATDLAWKDGTYSGQVEDHAGQPRPHGKGKWTRADHLLVLSGHFQHGALEGLGESNSVADKEWYLGEFKADLRHGHGSLFFASGGEHCGGFDQGKLEGLGVRVLDDGSWYVGHWSNDQLSETPTTTFPGPSGKARSTDKILPLPAGVVENSVFGAGVYTGQVNASGAPHGRGVVTLVDRTRYAGQFLNGVRNGHGVLTRIDGYKFDGEWKNDEMNGEGCEEDMDDNVYEGQFRKGVRHGQGVLREKGGGGYEGAWKQGEMHGQGKLTHGNGDIYVGAMREGMRWGKGECITKSFQYNGEWQKDAMHGKGVLTQLNGDTYTGQFQNGRRHGKGTLTCADGSKYEGQWQNGKPHGKGTHTRADGTAFTGTFAEGLYSGTGRLEIPDGRVYEGEFQEGLAHGRGKMTWKDGRVHVGSYEHGYRHGIGDMKWPDERRYQGEYVKGARHGEGKLEFSNGDTYIGQFQNNMADGKGIRVVADGTWYEGSWIKDAFQDEYSFRSDMAPQHTECNVRLQQENEEREQEWINACKQRNSLWSVSIPATEGRGGKRGHTVYSVRFTCKVTEAHLEKWLRYSELHDLNRRFCHVFPAETARLAFPAKKPISKLLAGAATAFVEERRKELETYLKGLAAERTITDSPEFREAFGIPVLHEAGAEYKARVGDVLRNIDAESRHEQAQRTMQRQQDDKLRAEGQHAAQCAFVAKLKEESERMLEEEKWLESERTFWEEHVWPERSGTGAESKVHVRSQSHSAANREGMQGAMEQAVEAPGNPFAEDGDGAPAGAKDAPGNPFEEQPSLGQGEEPGAQDSAARASGPSLNPFDEQGPPPHPPSASNANPFDDPPEQAPEQVPGEDGAEQPAKQDNNANPFDDHVVPQAAAAGNPFDHGGDESASRPAAAFNPFDEATPQGPQQPNNPFDSDDDDKGSSQLAAAQAGEGDAEGNPFV